MPMVNARLLPFRPRRTWASRPSIRESVGSWLVDQGANCRGCTVYGVLLQCLHTYGSFWLQAIDKASDYVGLA